MRAELGGGAGAGWRDVARRFPRAGAAALLTAVLVVSLATTTERAPAQPEAPSVEGVTDPDLQRLYGMTGWHELWSSEMRRQMATVLEGAARHGLDAAPVAQFGELDTASDTAVSKAALRYAQALATGAANPDKLHPVFALRRNQVDLVEGLATALATGRLVEWFDSLTPSDDQYRALSQAYLQARARAPQGEARPAPDGPTIQPGARDPRMPAIARLLVEQGYLAQATPRRPKGKGRSPVYGPPMVDAIVALQADNGLAADGAIDEATLQVLNGGWALRVRTLAVNLERLRWLARDPPPSRIDVNIAAAELQLYQDGQVIARRKVVVGAPKHETPPLEASFSRLVINPPWYVPMAIARREILPKGRRYMARHGMVVREGRVIQKPGPDSALGQVKFDLQDDDAIYLHDTPLKRLFDRSGRHLSHGCVRVQDAVGLAEWLAGAAGRLIEFQEALASSSTHTLDLGVEVPVRLVYLTAFADGDRVRRVPDAYGWDDGLAQALGLGPGGPRQSSDASPDLGP